MRLMGLFACEGLIPLPLLDRMTTNSTCDSYGLPMKPRLLQLLLVFLVVVASLATLVFVYLGHPLFGALPEGKRLQRLAQSANFQDGIFRNQIESPLHTAGSSELSILKNNIFGEKGQPRPDRVIPAVKTALKALDPATDLVVWLGHSSYYVQIQGQRLLIDPVFSDNAAPI
ncbi:transcription factor mediating antibiotic resistance [compost metagenome]